MAHTHRINDQFQDKPAIQLSGAESEGLRKLIDAHPRIADLLEAQSDPAPAILSDAQFDRLTDLLEKQNGAIAALSDAQFERLMALVEAQHEKLMALIQPVVELAKQPPVLIPGVFKNETDGLTVAQAKAGQAKQDGKD